MYLTHVSLKNFRSYNELSFEPGRRINILTGCNAQGKTNFLESLNILASSKSFRVKSEEELIHWDRDWAEIDAFASGSLSDRIRLTVRWAFNQAGALERRIFLNDIPVKRLGDFLGELLLVLFVPSDLALIQGSPTLRRRLLDVLLCKISPEYYSLLVRCQHIVHQRSKFLHTEVKGSGFDSCLTEPNLGVISAWNTQLIKYASKIVYFRLAALKHLETVVNDVCQKLADSSEGRYSLKYRSRIFKAGHIPEISADIGNIFNNGFDGEGSAAADDDLKIIENAFADALVRFSRREMASRTVQIGPHRDDFEIEYEGRTLKQFGSQGQHRSAALALRLAEAEIMSCVRGDKAVILLDDCFSELDKGRSERLISYLSGLECQVFITAAGYSGFFSSLHSEGINFFNVDNSVIKPMCG